MKKNNRQLISEMKQSLDNMSNKKRKLTLESYVFSEDTDLNNEFPYETDNPGFDDGQADIYDEGETVNPTMKPLIDKIRLMSLQCLQKLSNAPESPEYELFKKIWQLCDKSVDVNAKNGNNNQQPAAN